MHVIALAHTLKVAQKQKAIPVKIQNLPHVGEDMHDSTQMYISVTWRLAMSPTLHHEGAEAGCHCNKADIRRVQT